MDLGSHTHKSALAEQFKQIAFHSELMEVE